MQGYFALVPRTLFFQRIEFASAVGYFISFQKYKLQYFAILLNNNIIVAMQYLKTIIIFKDFSEKKKRLTKQ